MSAAAAQPTKRGRRGRGRVVMLVDNGVEGDSRVQKQARSMAERGWDVVLLGKSPDNKEHRWKIGDARVRLVPVSLPLAKRRYEFRLGRRCAPRSPTRRVGWRSTPSEWPSPAARRPAPGASPWPRSSPTARRPP